MDVTTETLSPTRVRMTVTVPFADLQPDVDSAYRKVAGSIRVPGFRPGRVPRQLVDQRVGRTTVLDEALQEALPRFYSQAVQDTSTDTLSRPEVDVTGFGDGEPLVFTAEVDVRPEVQLGDTQGLAVTVDDAEVTDDDVESQLADLQRSRGELVDAERPAADGDLLTVDIATTLDGEPVPAATGHGLSTTLGEGGLVPGLDAAVTGAAPGDERSFDTELQAGELAGRTAQVVVTVTRVQERRLPPLDDALAGQAGPYASLADLRTAVRDNLVRVKRLQQGLQARDRVLEALVQQADVPLPESVVHAEEHARAEQLQAQLDSYGLTLTSYLAGLGRDADAHQAEQRTEAEKAVRSQLVLDALAAREEVGVTEAELSESIVSRAQRAGMSPDVLAQQIVQAGQLQGLVGEVVRGKALALIMEEAVITDASGRPVDLQALAAEPPAAEVSDAEDAPGEVELSEEVVGPDGQTAADADSTTSGGPGVLLGPDGRPYVG